MISRAYQGRFMIRRRHEEAHENHERWVISYADFITLLFAFFVVMYSISSVNEGKYKVLSDSLVEVFHSQSRTINPVTPGDMQTRSSNDQLIQLPVPGHYPSNDDYKYSVESIFDDVETRAVKQGEMRDNEVSHLTKMSEKLAFVLQQQIEGSEVEVKNAGDWLEVNIQASVLFESGSASLSQPARDILGKVAGVLKDSTNPIHVEGYTDNLPIETRQFPSNWELSAARAASVVRLFQEQALQPERMAAVGYGEFHPVADNASDEGRARNRRISIVISKNEPVAPEPPPEAVAPDYKIGGGAADEPSNRQLGQRDRAATSADVPLRIIRLEDGSLLFSGDPPPQAQP